MSWKVPPGSQCPYCGEQETDRLVLQDETDPFQMVFCGNCSNRYPITDARMKREQKLIDRAFTWKLSARGWRDTTLRIMRTLQEAKPGAPVPVCTWCGMPTRNKDIMKMHAEFCEDSPAVKKLTETERQFDLAQSALKKVLLGNNKNSNALHDASEALVARAVQGGHENTTDGCDVVPSYLIDRLRAVLANNKLTTQEQPSAFVPSPPASAVSLSPAEREEMRRLQEVALGQWRRAGGAQHMVTVGGWARWLGPCTPEIAAYLEAAVNALPGLLSALDAAERVADELRRGMNMNGIAALRVAKERDDARRDYRDADGFLIERTAERDAARAEAATLRAALARYGVHLDHCEDARHGLPCDCGLSAAPSPTPPTGKEHSSG